MASEDESLGQPVGSDVWEATGAERVILTEHAYSQHGKVAATEGYLTLTNERLYFESDPGRASQGGALAEMIVERLTASRGVSIALADITAVRRTRHGFGKNVLDVEANGELHRFVPGWKKFPEPLRQALTDAGRTVTDAGTDDWQVG